MSGREMEKEIKRYLDMQAEDFQHRLNLAIDGLAGNIGSSEERLNQRISAAEKSLNANLTARIGASEERLSSRIDALRNEIISHRDNTEVHAQKARAKKKA